MRQRNHRVLFRLNDEEYLHFIKQVENTGLSQEEVLRGLIAGLEIQPRAPEGFAKMIALLSNMANNTNQIARIANSTRCIDDEQVARLLEMMQRIYRAGKDLVGWKIPQYDDAPKACGSGKGHYES